MVNNGLQIPNTEVLGQDMSSDMQNYIMTPKSAPSLTGRTDTFIGDLAIHREQSTRVIPFSVYVTRVIMGVGPTTQS